MNNLKQIIEEIFLHWKKVHEHPRVPLRPSLVKKIQARLKEGYSKEELLEAIEGCKLNPWHQGENPNGVKYDRLDLILRDSEHVDMFISLYEKYNGNKKKAEEPFLSFDQLMLKHGIEIKRDCELMGWEEFNQKWLAKLKGFKVMGELEKAYFHFKGGNYASKQVEEEKTT